MSYAFKHGTTLNDRYLVEDTLGLGGMSTVYLGHDPRLERKIAIKAIHPFLINHDTFLDRFKKEAAAIARLRHNNIVQVFDYNQHDGIHYIVLEYVSGGTLKDALETYKKQESFLPVEQILNIMLPLTDAVGYAHDLQMLHRDLKPDNVILRPNREPVLTDFGIVKMLSSGTHTQTGSLLGTIAYMSPEQIEGKAIDSRSDIYALGVVLYEMTTGQRPFTADSPLQMMMMHASEIAPPLEQYLQGERLKEVAPLEAIIQRMLAKQPDDRYQSAKEIKQDFSTLLSLLDTGTVIMPMMPGLEASAFKAGSDTGEFYVNYDSQLTEAFSPEKAFYTAQEDIDTLKEQINADPFREDFVRELMENHARCGDFINSLQVFNRFQKRFTAELGIDVHPETELLREKILSARLAKLHNLRPDASSFVGRDREIAALWQQSSREDCRLITLVGVGGIGKTRIAREFIRQVSQNKWRYFLHGAVWIPLDSLEVNAGEVAIVTAISQGLNMPLDGPTSPFNQLLTFLQNREILLVLDNFEHVIERVGLIQTLLDETKDLKILVTSRQRLNLPEEEILPIRGFSSVDIDPKQIETGAILSDGSRLFIQSAIRSQPNFKPNRKELEMILSICNLLEGMPLGIEIAASWTRALSCQEIEARLRSSLDFLAVNHKNLPKRHRSLQAAFDYSWVLLTDDEKRVIQNLSVIQGRFDLDAALTIGATAIEMMTSLVDKSLVQIIFVSDEGSTQSMQAYQLHPVVRHFAAHRLSQDPSGYQAAVDAHRTYYMTKLIEFSAGLLGPPQLISADQVEFNHDNIVTAWRDMLLQPSYLTEELELLYTGSKALTNYYTLFGIYGQGIEIITNALNSLPSAAPEKLKVILGISLSYLHTYISENERGLALLEEVTPYFGEQPDKVIDELLAFAHLTRASILSDIGKFDKSYSVAKLAHSVYQRLDMGYQEAHVLRFLGKLNYLRGKFGESYQFYDQAKSIYQNHGDQFYLSQIEATQALPLVFAGQHEKTIEILETDLELMKAWRNKRRMATDLLNLAWTYAHIGDLSKADSKIELSQIYYRECGDREGVASSYLIMGRIESVRGAYSIARSRFQQGLKIVAEINSATKVYEGIAGLALTMLKMEDDPFGAYRVAQFSREQIALGSTGFFYLMEIDQAAKERLSEQDKKAINQHTERMTLENTIRSLLNLKLN
ncbi:MAG: protein kinase [Chloroflexota bacterium]